MGGGKTIRGWPLTSEGAAALEADPPGGTHVDGKVDFGAFANEESWDGEEGPDQSGIFALASGLLFAGRYRLVTRIARGGMGSIWAATDERLGREVAVKFMSPDIADDDDYRHRFEQEARAAAKLSSVHVVGIHDHGVADGIPFIVLERLDGEDLHKRLRQVKRIPLEACDRIFTQSGKALRAAHDAGIVHRDIKPQNLFLAKVPEGEEGEEIVKLLDFGVAKHSGTDFLHTKTGVLVGSPHFMSPEQVKGQRNIDFRTDLFSLAAVMYRCVTGARPYEGEMPQVMIKITKDPPTPPSDVIPELPRGLDAFFLKALAIDPAARFPSATAMARAFHAVVEESRAAAGRTSTPEKLTRETTLRFALHQPQVKARPSERPTMVRETEDKVGPLSPGDKAPMRKPHDSDAPTQVVPANQITGFSEAEPSSNAPSPWKKAAPDGPADELDFDEAELLGKRAARIAFLAVAAMSALLVVLVVLLATWD